MAGRRKLLLEDITLNKKLKGKALADALAAAMNQDEKTSTYMNRGLPPEKPLKKRKK